MESNQIVTPGAPIIPIANQASGSKPELICDICGFKTRSKRGFAGHTRLAHEKPTKQETYKEYIDVALRKQNEQTMSVFEAIRETLKSILVEIKDTKKTESKTTIDVQPNIKKVEVINKEKIEATIKEREKIEREIKESVAKITGEYVACPECNKLISRGNKEEHETGEENLKRVYIQLRKDGWDDGTIVESLESLSEVV